MSTPQRHQQGAWKIGDPEAPIHLLHGLGRVEPVWKNKAGIFVGYLPDNACYVKFAAHRVGLLRDEADRLAWMQTSAPNHPIPRLVRFATRTAGTILVTAAIAGDTALAARTSTDEISSAIALAVGLRKLHALTAAQCPFDWSATTRIGTADRLGLRIPHELRVVPSPDREVICHGEAFLPNVIVDHRRIFAAHLDLPRLGRADRWADLAAATLSLEWNFPGLDMNPFWRSYGTHPDLVRLAYYRELWQTVEAAAPWARTSTFKPQTTTSAEDIE